MANVTDTTVGESQIQEPWFQAIDPISLTEACELRPQTWWLFHDEGEEEQKQQPSNHEQPTPLSAESIPVFDPERVRDSITVYKDRKRKSPGRARKMPNALSEVTITDNEASGRGSTSSNDQNIRSQASNLSKAIAKSVARGIRSFLLCTPSDNCTSHPARVVSLPANASTISKLRHRFMTCVGGTSHGQPLPQANKHNTRTGVAATTNISPTFINNTQAPTSTFKPHQQPEALPIFNTSIWHAPPNPSFPNSSLSQPPPASPPSSSSSSKKTWRSSTPLPPKPFLHAYTSDQEDLFFCHREWIPDRDISPGTSISPDGYSDCQSDVRTHNDLYSQHCGWEVKKSVASSASVYSRSLGSRGQSWASSVKTVVA